jgi:hypothetical protein
MTVSVWERHMRYPNHPSNRRSPSPHGEGDLKKVQASFGTGVTSASASIPNKSASLRLLVTWRTKWWMSRLAAHPITPIH